MQIVFIGLWQTESSLDLLEGSVVGGGWRSLFGLQGALWPWEEQGGRAGCLAMLTHWAEGKGNGRAAGLLSGEQAGVCNRMFVWHAFGIFFSRICEDLAAFRTQKAFPMKQNLWLTSPFHLCYGSQNSGTKRKLGRKPSTKTVLQRPLDFVTSTAFLSRSSYSENIPGSKL